MGKERVYREYVCSNRDKAEQEIREKMTNGAIGAAGVQEQMDNPSQSGDGGNRGDQDRGEEGNRVFHFPLHKTCG